MATLPGSGTFRAELPNSTDSWAHPPGQKTAPEQSAYGTQFFSGNNVFVFIYPLMKKKFIPIPVVAMSYGVTQEKVPIYGAWSYTFDAVARGNKLVKGELAIVFTYPNMLGQLIGVGEAPSYAQVEDAATKSTYEQIMPTVISDADLAKAELRKDIWGIGNNEYLNKPYGASTTGKEQPALPFGQKAPTGKNEADYSGHQPFDIIICYGDNPEVSRLNNNSFDYDTWALSAMDLLTQSSKDYNEEIKGSWGASKRVHIKNVELMSSGTQIDITGQPLQESYTFIAKDVTTPV